MPRKPLPEQDKPTAQQLMQELADADNKVATCTGALKAAKEAYDQVADRLFALMDEQGTEALRNAAIGLQVSISETDVDIIEDWDSFENFVRDNDALYLLQRRLSVVALRELLESRDGEAVPGLATFTKRRLHVTKFSK